MSLELKRLSSTKAIAAYINGHHICMIYTLKNGKYATSYDNFLRGSNTPFETVEEHLEIESSSHQGQADNYKRYLKELYE